MKYELKKLFLNRSFRVIVVLLLVFNGLFYYSAMTDTGKGFAFRDIRDVWADEETVSEKLELTEEKLNELLQKEFNDQEEFELLEIYRKDRAVLNAALERIRESASYSEYLDALLKENLVKRKSGIFGDEDSFNYKALEKSYNRYKALVEVTPAVAWYGGVEFFLNWRYTDLIGFVVPVILVLFLMVSERRSSGLLLAYHTAKGKKTLIVSKIVITLMISIVMYLILFMENWILSSFFAGYGPLDVPVQSVYGMINVPFKCSVSQYLLIYAGDKALWMAAVSSLLFLLAVPADLFTLIFSITILAAVSYLLNLPANPVINLFSLVSLSDPVRWTAGLGYTDLFGYPCDQLVLVILILVLIIVVSFITSLFLYRKTGPMPYRRNAIQLRMLRRPSHSLFRYEGFKLYGICHGFVAVLLIIVLQVYGFCSSEYPLFFDEQVYREYSMILQGEKTREKEDYLEKETKRFEALYEQFERYSQMDISDEVLNELTAGIRMELERENGFQRAKNQYLSLSQEDQYVYLTGYQRLYSHSGLKTDLLHLLLCLLLLVLVIPRYVCMEYESGVVIQQNILGKRRTVERKKRWHIWLFTLLVMIIAFGFEYGKVARDYGLYCLSASVSSLPMIRFPFNLPIFMILLITNLIRLGGLVLAGEAMGLVSRKIKNTFSSTAVLLVTILLPGIIFYLLY